MKIALDKKQDWGIVGNDFQVRYLKSNIENNDIAHAYLFIGEENLGKKTIALAFIKSILCDAESTSSFCSKCDNCRKVDTFSHPDVMVLDSDSVIKIEDVRKLLSNLFLKPFNSTHKIAIINNAERLTKEAGNALLKTLEEPTGHAVIFLIAKNKNLLLPTIVSRTRVVKFFPASNKSMIKLLGKGFRDEGMIAILVSAGKPGKLLEIIKNPELLNFFKKAVEDLSCIISSDKITAFRYSENMVKEYENSRAAVIEKISSWILALREMLYLRKNKGHESLLLENRLVKALENSNDAKIISVTSDLMFFSHILANESSGLNIKLLLDILVLKIEKLGK